MLRKVVYATVRGRLLPEVDFWFLKENVVFRGWLAALLIAFPVVAQSEGPAPIAETLVAHASNLIREHYVFPEGADAILARLDESLATGRYNVDSRERLAQLVTEDLQAVTNDKHMNVKYKPELANGPVPSGGSGPSAGNSMAAIARASNQGITELRILPGNIRYMNISLFHWHEGLSQKAYDEAINFLREGDAYIIDIRGTGGGSPSAVNYLTSHLMAPDQHLMTYRIGPSQIDRSVTRSDLTGDRLPDRPLFLLVGPGSASAAEEFAAHVRNFRLGTLIGQTTAGAGHRNGLFLTPNGFELSVSTGTALHAVTNEGWEGTGFEPHMLVPVPSALEVAHVEALRRIRASATGPQAARLDWLIEDSVVKINPVQVDAIDFVALPGNFAGNRKVSARGGKLYYHLGPHEWELLPMGNDLFAVVSGPPLRLRISREDGRPTGITQISSSGQEQLFPRI